MSVAPVAAGDNRTDDAVRDLTALISARYPATTFKVGPGENPPGTYILASVDVPDDEDVLDVVVDCLLEMQVDEGLPVYVIPLSTPERTAEIMRARRERGEPRWAGQALLDTKTPLEQPDQTLSPAIRKEWGK